MDKPTITFGSLFAGIGGLDLGFERAGFQVKWQVEIDDYATKVLAKHWPDVTRFRDVRECGKHNLEPVDCIIGGFPCQPHSNAGQRKASKDERNLWPEFHRLICELGPRWIVAENVLGLLSSEDGAFFGGILRDLAEAGYDARWQVLSAAQFGAPHLRERVILVAHANSDNWRRTQRANTGGMAGACGADTEGQWHSQWDAYQCGGSPLAYPCGAEWRAGTERWCHVFDWADAGWQESRWIESTDRARRSGESTPCSELAYANGQRCEECDITAFSGEQGHAAWRNLAPGSVVADAQHRGCEWGMFDTYQSDTTLLCGSTGTGTTSQSCLGRAVDGLSSWLDRYRWPAGPGQEQYDWEAPRVTTEKVANRPARLKGLGNAVIPALAEYVGRCIMAAEAEREVRV